MEDVPIIPSFLEENLSAVDGTKGASLKDAFKLEAEAVQNLYTIQSRSTLAYAFTDRGVGYNDKESTSMTSRATFELGMEGGASFELQFEEKLIVQWGINFCGCVHVEHKTGTKRIIYIPGTRTYDPAGMTGDPHSSERIGPSCSRSQASITVAELVAAKNGGTLEQIGLIQEGTRAAILHYHGRECLFDWMRLQIEEAIFKDQDVTPYPEFIKLWVKERDISLSGNREHTQAYLESYDKNTPIPPIQYFKKVAVKDDVSKILDEDQLKKFQKLVGPDK